MMDRIRAYFQVWNPAKEHIMLTGTGCWVLITEAVSKSLGSYRIMQIALSLKCASWQNGKS